MLFSHGELLTAAYTRRALLNAVTRRCLFFRTWRLGALKLTGVRMLRWRFLLVPRYFASRRAPPAPHLRLTLRAIDIGSVS